MYTSKIICMSLKPNDKWCTFSQSVILDLAVKKVSSSPWVIWPCCKKSVTSLSSSTFRGFRLKQLQYTSARIKNNSNIRAPITATTTCHQMNACLNWNMKRNSNISYEHTSVSNEKLIKMYKYIFYIRANTCAGTNLVLQRARSGSSFREGDITSSICFGNLTKASEVILIFPSSSEMSSLPVA